MFLISIYFDDETEKRLSALMTRVAKVTGNNFVLDNHIPPHITVAAAETKCEDELLERMEKLVEGLNGGEIRFVSVGNFSTKVVFVQPVLNEYLHQLTVTITRELEQMDETILSPYYKPFSWLPHCTIAKQLSKQEMQTAFSELLQHFIPVNGHVTRLGVAKTNPHRDIKVWELYIDDKQSMKL